MKVLRAQTFKDMASLKPTYRWSHTRGTWDFVVRSMVCDGQRFYTTRPWWSIP